MLGKKEKIKLCGSVLPKSHNIHKQGLGIGRNSKHNLLCYRNVNGSRIRVEHSTGKVRPKPWLRGGRSGRGRRPFHPEDRCYECGESGHYAYDCPRYRRGGRRYSTFNWSQLAL